MFSLDPSSHHFYQREQKFDSTQFHWSSTIHTVERLVCTFSNPMCLGLFGGRHLLSQLPLSFLMLLQRSSPVWRWTDPTSMNMFPQSLSYGAVRLSWIYSKQYIIYLVYRKSIWISISYNIESTHKILCLNVLCLDISSFDK